MPSPVASSSTPDKPGGDTPIPLRGIEPRTWEVRETIGDYDELLGTVRAVHQPNAYTKAIAQFRIFDTDRMTRIRLHPLD
jgi:hypothetical protein